MKKTGWLAVVVSALLALGALSCGGDSGGNDNGKIDPGAWEFTEYQFVLDELTLPENSTTAKELGFDLDGNGTPDNQLGNILSALGSAMGDTTPQVSVDEQMAAGSLIVLFSIYAQDIQSSATSNLWAFLGDAADPALDAGPQPGSEWTVSATSPQNAYFGGKIKNGGGLYGGSAATLGLQIPLTSSGVLDLSLKAVHVEFDVSTDGSALEEGRLGGAITEDDLNTKVMPTVATLLNDQLSSCTYDAQADPPCACEEGSGAATIESMFDTNEDCEVTQEEVAANSIIQTFLKPDIELADGTKALSLAVGFHAVDATFTHPAPPIQ